MMIRQYNAPETPAEEAVLRRLGEERILLNRKLIYLEELP